MLSGILPNELGSSAVRSLGRSSERDVDGDGWRRQHAKRTERTPNRFFMKEPVDDNGLFSVNRP